MCMPLTYFIHCCKLRVYLQNIINLDETTDAHQTWRHCGNYEAMLRVPFCPRVWLYRCTSIFQDGMGYLFLYPKDSFVNEVFYVL